MRGSDATTGAMFSYVDIEARVPAKHPIRVIRRIVNAVLGVLDAEFAAMYARIGRPSIAPEKLLRASLLQAFFTVRSERLLMERLDYDLMFRWFSGLGIDDPVWDHSTFSKNCDRLFEADIARKLLKSILEHKEVAPLLSDEHFTVDGTLVTAWASLKSFVPKEAAAAAGVPPPGDGQGKPPPSLAKPKDEAAKQPQTEKQATQPASAEPSKPETAAPMQTATEADKKSRNEEVNFHGKKRSNATHASTTDPKARLFRKGPGKEARLSFVGARHDREPARARGRDRLHTGDRDRRARASQGHDRAPLTGLHAAPHGRCRQGLRCGRLRRRPQGHVRDAARRPEGQGLGHR